MGLVAAEVEERTAHWGGTVPVERWGEKGLEAEREKEKKSELEKEQEEGGGEVRGESRELVSRGPDPGAKVVVRELKGGRGGEGEGTTERCARRTEWCSGILYRRWGSATVWPMLHCS